MCPLDAPAVGQQVLHDKAILTFILQYTKAVSSGILISFNVGPCLNQPNKMLDPFLAPGAKTLNPESV